MSYVGQTSRSLPDRIRSHYGCSGRRKFNRALRATPEGQWAWEILEIVYTVEEAFERECYWIAKLNCYTAGYNSPAGSQKDDAAREKISAANKGREPWNKGRVGIYSDEALTRMALAKMGKACLMPPGWKKNHTEATQKAFGRKVINLETGETYPSVCEAARSLGVALSTVKRVLNGKIKNSAIRLIYD